MKIYEWASFSLLGQLRNRLVHRFDSRSGQSGHDRGEQYAGGGGGMI